MKVLWPASRRNIQSELLKPIIVLVMVNNHFGPATVTVRQQERYGAKVKCLLLTMVLAQFIDKLVAMESRDFDQSLLIKPQRL